ncbi:YadA family autotransporter adhesin [Burkholderia ubonensis]|uniref:YadA family autotransporter adhesin n=1 Tax=Burkholderia ubonensis TaxID=101571 RepID=UPI0009B490D1|nr:YadA-like family protein [Burkholderia ubonensis]
MKNSYQAVFDPNLNRWAVTSELTARRRKSHGAVSSGLVAALAGGATLFSASAFAGQGYEVGCGDSGEFTANVAIGGKGGCPFGGNAKANGNGSIAIGNGSMAGYGNGGVGTSISGLDAGNNFQISLGTQSKATGQAAVGLGWRAGADGIAATALGYGANASGNSSLAIGDTASASGFASLALGGLANASGQNSAALGAQASAVGDNSNAIGSGSAARSGGSTAVGAGAVVDTGADDAISVGNGAFVDMASRRSIAIGAGATIAPALTDSIAFGSRATVNSRQSLAIGSDASVGASSSNSTAIGMGASVGENAWSSIAIGQGARVNDLAFNAVALGQGSVADRADTISIGSAGHERWITNVRPGYRDTDAVNVAQLRAAGLDIKEPDPNNPNGNVGVIETPFVLYDSKDKSKITLGGKDAAAPVALKNVAAGAEDTDAVTVAQLKQAGLAVGNGSNSTGNGGVSLGTGSSSTGDRSTSIGSGSVASGDKAVAVGANANASGNGSAAFGGGASAGGQDSLALGRNANAPANNSVALGAGSVANEADTVSVGSPGHERRITNVADGVGPNDAVNMRQFQNGISDIARKAYSGVAAASALSMIPDVDQGKTVAVGVGTANYQGYQAVALGLSARITQNLKVRVGTSMASAGTTWGVGASYQW